jgi:hypothetical protein
MDDIIEFASKCPKCKMRHTQSFSKEDLRELLKEGALSLYCNQRDEVWPAPEELRGTLSLILAERDARGESTATVL